MIDPVRLVERCLREADGDTAAGLAAAEYILVNGLEPAPDPEPPPRPLSAFFAHDAANPAVQAVLDGAMAVFRDVHLGNVRKVGGYRWARGWADLLQQSHDFEDATADRGA